ncbi:DUF2637 domain-containing protein [Mycolicibacter virginiensis]|uniref:DUF2637 domain-containing protein n=1 Tax=Mycolicibacter virginiensis TaxID=1795032 RepID=UPI001F049A1F|nr:DUF2637 domain-containing protein [Mycolicibacter virginiensis]ULP45889.1 DUF2637 domain-containing protein [Mycolicibacter virginiensis]
MSMRRWRYTLAVAVAASVAGNVRYAWLTGSAELAAEAGAVAAAAPLFLFFVTHNLAAEPAGITRGWRQKAALAGAWAITAAAFAASYQQLHAYVQVLGLSSASAWLTPLIVDVTIAVASVKVLDPASVAPARVATGDHAAATSDHAVAASPAAPVADPATDPPAAGHSGAGLHLVAGQGDRHLTSADHAAAGVDGMPAASPDAHLGRAEELVAAGVVKAPVPAVATALAGLADGGSHRAVAAATGLHRTSIARLATAAEEVMTAG